MKCMYNIEDCKKKIIKAASMPGPTTPLTYMLHETTKEEKFSACLPPDPLHWFFVLAYTSYFHSKR